MAINQVRFSFYSVYWNIKWHFQACMFRFLLPLYYFLMATIFFLKLPKIFLYIKDAKKHYRPNFFLKCLFWFWKIFFMLYIRSVVSFNSQKCTAIEDKYNSAPAYDETIFHYNSGSDSDTKRVHLSTSQGSLRKVISVFGRHIKTDCNWMKTT